MIERADLHCHTNFSDGKFSVDEVIERAIKNNVKILAITDHDCLDGAIEASKTKKDIKIIFGIELSTVNNSESVHVLGYFREPITTGKLVEGLVHQAKERKERAYKIIEKLEEKFNIKLDNSFILQRPSTTRGTIASEIIKQGYPYSRKEIFDKILGDNCPCYIPSTKMSTEYGIKLIKESGGIAVVAHPCLYSKENNVMEFIKMGIDGIEGIYPSKKNQESTYRTFAKNYGLIITAGSDFHFVNDQSHGDIGQCTISGKDLEKFLKVLDNA